MWFRNFLIRFIRRTPLWLLVLIWAVGWTTLQLGTRLLRGDGIDAWWVVYNGIMGIVLGSFMMWMALRFQAREKLQAPGSPTNSNIATAMSTGKLPVEASAGAWVPQLRKTLRQERHIVWAGPLLFGLFTALGIFLVLDSPDHPWFGGLFAAACLGTTAWYPLWIRRRRAQIQRLLDQLPDSVEA